ncbi:MAG TPA: SDR family NAD(P)-dependent oxidoreductase [bacterium]|nr:SDR family NAD(P)-dependent oxidoreductase [bacterium]
MGDAPLVNQDLAGRVALVTGGATGIGRAVALALVRQGADLAVLDINAQGAQETACLAQAYGRQAIALPADVSDYDAVRAALEQVRGRLGAPVVVVCNAGIAGTASLFRNERKANWDRLFAVHVDGAFHCVRETINPMLDGGWGRIVLISSVAATLGWKGAAGYAAAKGALLGFMRSLALECAGRGVTANAVCPGVIETALMREGTQRVLEQLREAIPMRRIGQPEDIAAAVAYLCSEQAGYVTGQVISPNGGLWVQ